MNSKNIVVKIFVELDCLINHSRYSLISPPTVKTVGYGGEPN